MIRQIASGEETGAGYEVREDTRGAFFVDGVKVEVPDQSMRGMRGMAQMHYDRDVAEKFGAPEGVAMNAPLAWRTYPL